MSLANTPFMDSTTPEPTNAYLHGFRDEGFHQGGAIETHAADDVHARNVTDLALYVHVLLELTGKALNMRSSTVRPRFHKGVVSLLLVVLPEV